MTTKQRSPILAATGGLFLIAGIITGFAPVSEYGVNCGAPFNRVPSFGTTISGYLVQSGCTSAVNQQGIIMWGLYLVGVVLLLLGLRQRTVKDKDVPGVSGSAAAAAPSVSKSSQMEDAIALHEDGTLNAEQFQAAKDRILGKTTVQSGQKTKLDTLHASGALSDAEYLAAVERLG